MEKDQDLRLILRKFLFIPEKYTKSTKQNDRVTALVHRSWLSALLHKGHPDIFKYHEKLSEYEVDLFLKLDEPFDPCWQLLSIRVLKLLPGEKVYPLPRARQINTASLSSQHLTYSQLFHYIAHTNYKNSWKESHTKYSNFDCSKESQIVPLLDKKSVLLEVVKRLYCCPVINLETREVHPVPKTGIDTHPNCLPTVCALFTSQHLFLLQNHVPYSLSDCVTFSPAVLNYARSKSLFIVFQLLQLLRDCHDKGVIIGDVNLHDLLISSSLWVNVLPKLENNLISPDQNYTDAQRFENGDENAQTSLTKALCNPDCEKGVNELVDLWVRGQVSNFDYLMALNSLAGRKFGHPSHHHVLPWVTDFSSPNGGWRDLSKSKFRLNKGDRQLDLTFETATSQQNCDSIPLQIPHHVSDFLSEITYFVYLARRTPKSLLCKYVRPNWVPAEYPSSIQRMQEWTPDECIPEFYSNPNTFKSIHEDLPDLELPSWASSPEHFVEKHRQALESIHVSERLHHWIDLTFGYKLSGHAAVKSKNVCLYLVDNHISLSDCGVVQLFTQPHPHRITPNPYLEKVAPKISAPANTRRLENTLPCILSPAVLTPDKIEDEKEPQDEHLVDKPGPLGISKSLSKSRISLQEDTFKCIVLPKDFNPISALQDVESLFYFSSDVLHDNPKHPENQQSSIPPYKKAMALSRVKEMQTLGCLIVDIYLSSKLRATDFTHNSFETRLDQCLKVVEREWKDLPYAVRKVTSVLLRVDEFGRRTATDVSMDWYQSVSQSGLPPPSAHQLLQPLLSGVIPFPEYFEQLYILLAEINKMENCPEETSELQVNLFHKELPVLLPKMDADGLTLLIPHVVRLLKSESATNAAWRLFDPLAKALGPQKAAKDLLEPISDLMDIGGACRAKLYHRSFLLKLMVRFGLKVFINNFVKSLVEAVGGYKDQECKTPTLESERRKSEALISVDDFALCEGEIGILSPLDEDSSADSEKLQTQQEITPGKKEEETDTENEPEVFMFESNENEEESAANTVTSPAVALDLMAQLEIDMDQEPENTVQLTEPDEEKEASPTFESEEVAVTPIQTEWRPPRRPATATEFPVSEESAESLLWLAHRLGPVLTARHLSRNLLRMLSLCYLAESNMSPSKGQDTCCQTIPGMKIIGDENSTRVISCLSEIAAIYGEQLVVVQYFGHMTELIALCRRKLTLNLEAGLIGCLSLLCCIIPYLTDTTLMDHISDILKNILHPSVRLVATTRAPFPSGSAARLALAYKLLEALYVISMRIGMDMTKLHLSVTLQRYFLAFDKAYDRTDVDMCTSGYLEVKRDGSELVLKGSPLQISQVMCYESIDSFSPPAPIQEAANEIRSKALQELKAVFNEKLAHCIYVPFYRLLGETVMEKVIKNEGLIRDLCYQYEKNSPRLNQCQGAGSFVYLSDLLPSEENLAGTSSSFGTNVAVIGNRIELQRPDIPSTLPSPSFKNLDEVSSIINKRMENTSRHLRGNWLAYWDHEIGRPDKDTKFNFKQIKLQQFTGHTHSVRALHVLDNENSFISGSRDKSVKLWSLRSQGDGATASTCRWSYNQHRKSVLAIAYVEPLGLVASCDSVVHLWDPFMGSNVAVLDGASRTTNSPVNVLHAMPAPSCLVLAATTDSTLKVIDVRTGEYVIEMKVANAAGGLIRCICASASGSWVAVGQASGYLSLLDIRTGMILTSWKGHEGEVLQLATSPCATVVSSSLDQSVAAWNSDNGLLRCLMKGPTEPVHCLGAYNNELITGTTANRIGVHTAVGEQASFSSTRLRSDTFKGVLTAMAVLPLNRLLLLGSDAGHISLLC